MTDIEVLQGLRNFHINDTYKGRRILIVLSLAILALQEKLERENPKPLGLEELGKIELFGWVWVEIVDKMEIGKSGYYQKHSDWSDGERFCCGYPGTMFGFKFSDYGKSWLAYRYKPDVVSVDKIEHIGEATNMVEPEWKKQMMHNFTQKH